MKINKATLDLVKRFEGLELEAYKDAVGVWTIGYGHSENAGFGIVPVAGMKITEPQAAKLLRTGLEHFSDGVADLLTRDATANQFGAMVSLAFNIGLGAFGRSTCLRQFNAGDLQGAAEALTWFNKAKGKKLRGLVRRRAAEAELFLSGEVAEITPTPDEERKASQSTTMRAGIFSLGGLTTAGTAVGQLNGSAQIIVIAALVLAAFGVAWMMRERIKKFLAGDR